MEIKTSKKGRVMTISGSFKEVKDFMTDAFKDAAPESPPTQEEMVSERPVDDDIYD